jgi:hypothetical protein
MEMMRMSWGERVESKRSRKESEVEVEDEDGAPG